MPGREMRVCRNRFESLSLQTAVSIQISAGTGSPLELWFDENALSICLATKCQRSVHLPLQSLFGKFLEHSQFGRVVQRVINDPMDVFHGRHPGLL